jgi:glucose-1-phosphate thymidylyltransferase
MQAVVLAAGKGSRLRPLSEDKPKVLVRINGTSLI